MQAERSQGFLLGRESSWAIVVCLAVFSFPPIPMFLSEISAETLISKGLIFRRYDNQCQLWVWVLTSQRFPHQTAGLRMWGIFLLFWRDHRPMNLTAHTGVGEWGSTKGSFSLKDRGGIWMNHKTMNFEFVNWRVGFFLLRFNKEKTTILMVS